MWQKRQHIQLRVQNSRGCCGGHGNSCGGDDGNDDCDMVMVVGVVTMMIAMLVGGRGSDGSDGCDAEGVAAANHEL